MRRLASPLEFRKLEREKIHLTKGGWVMVACGKDTEFEPVWASWEGRGTKKLEQEIWDVLYKEIEATEKRLGVLREFAVRGM